MVRWPRPSIEPDPRPAVRRDRCPIAVVIRSPPRIHDRVPDVTVRLLVLPRSVLIQRGAIQSQIRGELLTGLRAAQSLIPLGKDPLIESVVPNGIERLRVARRLVVARETP